MDSVRSTRLCNMTWDWSCRAEMSFIATCAEARSVAMSARLCCVPVGVRRAATRWLREVTTDVELGFVGDVVTLAKTATPCSAARIACSLARTPYWTADVWSTRAVDDAVEGPEPASPVYQATVFAAPLTRAVAVFSGVPPTRSGGWIAVTVGPKPSAANAAAFELVTLRLAASSVRIVITPPLTDDGVEVPVIESIFVSNVWTLSLTLSWFPCAPEATNVSVLPLTVMVSPTAKFVASESVFAAPDSSVAPVIGAGTAALLLTTPPTAMLSVLKKLSEAAMAEAATSEVLASVPSAVVSAALRLVAVAVELAPIAKHPLGGGVELEAVSVIASDVPSGKLNVKVTFSPLFGLVAPRSTDIAGGDPLGPLIVEPVNDDVIALSLKPNGEPATSSAIPTDVGEGEEIDTR